MKKLILFTLLTTVSLSFASYADTNKFQISDNSTTQYDNESMSYYKKGRELYKKLSTKSLEESVEVYSKGIAINNKNPYLYAGRAESKTLLYTYQILKLATNNAKAKIEYEIFQDASFAMSLNPNLLESHRAMGAGYTAKDNKEEAIVEIKKAIEINKLDAESYSWLSNSYAPAKKDLKKLNIARANALSPDDPLVKLFTALEYSNIPDYWTGDEQIAIFEDLSKFSPENDIIYTFLGFWHQRYKSDTNKSITYLNKALNIDENNPLALYVLGNTYLYKRNNGRAVEYYKKACDLNVEAACKTLKALNY